MPSLTPDLRYALRNMLLSPMFAVVALSSLALGIGANTAIFSLMDQLMIRLLPVKEPHRLVLLKTRPDFGRVEGDNTFSYPMYRDLRDRNEVFEGVIARYNTPAALAYRGATERVSADLVSGNFFQVLGVPPAIGRLFSPADDLVRAGHPLVVLGHGYWTRRFAADHGVVGQTLRVNGAPMTIIGVTPRGFYGMEAGTQPDIMVPLSMKPVMTPEWDDLDNLRSMWLRLAARLKSGVSQTQANASLAPLVRALLQEETRQFPAGMDSRRRQRFLDNSITVAPGARGASQLRDQFSSPLLVLMAMVGLVLLIACANLANLLIARAAARQREIAIRLALGASRADIFRQLMVESLVLALAGGLLGILVAGWTSAALIRFLPDPATAQSLSSDPDWRVMLFAVALSLATGLLFGIVPAWQATRSGVAGTLKDQATSVSAGKSHVRFRLALVVAQVSLSLLLLIGAGLFAASLYHLRELNPGFQTSGIMTFAADPQLNGYSQPRVRDFFDRLSQSIAALPGVETVSMAEVPLLQGWMAQMTTGVEGYTPKDGENMNPAYNWIGPRFFDTLGIQLLAGRDFNAGDIPGSPRVAIINETMARKYFEGRNPVGRRLTIGGALRPRESLEIVGVVRDLKQRSLRDEPLRMVFVPYQHETELGRMTMYLRVTGDPAAMGQTLRREVTRIDSDLPIFELHPLTTVVDDSIFTDRLIATLAAFFGVLATVLAAIGLYGVMAYTVARRTRELGVRIALGARQQTILGMVMREVALLVGLGILLAIPLANALGRTLESQLYGVKAADPAVISAAAALLAAVALTAGLLPAWRASRIDPVVALRYE
jgi:predicted permease